MKKCVFSTVCVLSLLACASAPVQQLRYSTWHHTYSIFLDPDRSAESPQFRLALSLLQVTGPAEQVDFLNALLYSAEGVDEYRNRLIVRKRDEYRAAVSVWYDHYSDDWRYAESMSILALHEAGGLVVRRDFETVSCGKNLLQVRFYVVDLASLRRIRIDDLFSDFQGTRTRTIVYNELRRHSGLPERRPLSDGGFFSDYPELSFNFHINRDGLGLRWDPGEIAPHSKGGIDLLMPWQSIRHVLCCHGMETLALFGIYPG